MTSEMAYLFIGCHCFKLISYMEAAASRIPTPCNSGNLHCNLKISDYDSQPLLKANCNFLFHEGIVH